MRKTITIVLLAMIFSLNASAQKRNMIPNGDFEMRSGSESVEWTVGNGIRMTDPEQGDVPVRGNYSLHIVGQNMLDNKFEYFIRSNANFVGNGHNSGIVKDDEGREWILYHGYDKKDSRGRRLFLDEVKWASDGWPYISGASPSIKADAPVFYDIK